jgi:peptidoglycan/xylan/chitin deacetylase (PgdA/CDA1 family)
MYHSIGGRDRHAVESARFSEQMRWLKHESGVSIAPLMAAVSARSAAATTLALTFDDGYRSVLTHAAPVLVRLGLPFTVFVIGEHLLGRDAAYLDTIALRELAAVPGVTLGAHSYTHRPLTRLDDVALGEELQRSVDILIDVAGRRPAAMSYPYGALDRRVVGAVRRAGFTAGATSLHGVNRPRTPSLRLRRTEIDAFDDDASFAGKVRGDYDWYQWKQRVYWPVPEDAMEAHPS